MAKRYIFGSLIFFIFLLSRYAVAAYSQQQLDKIAAVVNGDVITQSELDKRVALFSRQSPGSKVYMLRKQVLDSLIDSLLQMQLAQNIGIQVANIEIDHAISDIAKNNQLTVEQLQKSLQEHEGIDIKEYREQIREQLLIARVQQQSLGKDIVVNDKEVEKVLRNPPKTSAVSAQYHVADVLIVLPDNASSSQVNAASDVVSQVIVKLKQGISIEQTEQVQSIDLGVRKIDELPALFAKEVAKMQVGQVIGPIRAPNGLHLLKLLETQGQQQEVKFTKERAREFVFHQKLEEKLKVLLKELRAKAYIKIID